MLVVSSPAYAEGRSSSDEEVCQEFVAIPDNIKNAHLNENCLKAADSGSGPSQYSVGMSYGFLGEHKLEEKYYKLAAEQHVKAAYLALGHLYRENKVEEAIHWYQRYIETKAEGYGYAASLLSDIYLQRGDKEKAQKWLEVCQSSPYGENCGS